MDNNIKRALNGPSATSYRSRIPLANRSNISSLARQRSPENIWNHKDSSESQPSSPSSIYNAGLASDPDDLAISPYRTPDLPLVPVSSPTARPMTPPSRTMSIDPNSESPLSRLEASTSASTFETPFLYGHGTELAPIAEQRSIATLRTNGSPATSNISPLLKHQPSSLSSKSFASSAKNTPPRRALRRQHSFSLDDLTPPPPRRAPAGENSDPGVPRLRNTSKRHSPPAVSPADIHAYPQRPLYPAHHGPPTPLGWLDGGGSHHYPALEVPFRGVRSGHGDLLAHPWQQQQRGGCDAGHHHPGPPWTCKACGRPADQRWSLLSTLIGQGAGMRRGDDWCTRCAWRKVIYLWCCCEPLGVSG
ncbi:hypothetical protein F4804DRAFT_352098 [Jackrogersella minutella]|nr:hypothetical protein F4804DRAFT_352098 [Jackrogersella minutella]